MPLTEFQKRVIRLLLGNRSQESYLAGGSVIHRAEESPRFSRDLDIFHESHDEVERSARRDEAILLTHGLSVEWRLQSRGFLQAVVRDLAEGQAVKIDWAHESSFRFFPLVEDEVFGFRLHDADLATNKVLALASRQTARDFLDALYLHQNYLSLGALIWAASGKDPGLTPEMILNEARRESRYSQEALEQAQEEVDLHLPINVERTKAAWLKACEESEALFSLLPPEQIGCLYLDRRGKAVTPDELGLPRFQPHFASARGTLPQVSPTEF